MGIVDSVKQVADIAMKLGNIELSKRILDLQQEIIELTHQNWELKNDKKELEEKLQVKAKMSFKAPFWYMEGDSVPYCPKCYEGDQKLAHLQFIPEDESCRSYQLCHVCNKSY